MRKILIATLFVLCSLSVSVSAYMACEDSDGGSAYTTYGNVRVTQMSVPGPSDWTYYYDGCASGTSPVSSCSGSSCNVQEYTCSGAGYSWSYQSTFQSCTSLGYSGCSGGVCSGTLASCTDGSKNGQETDKDCGGFTCSPCVTGQTCILSSDCESSVCNGGVCYAPVNTCSDGIENGGEDGVDCGGSCSDSCADLLITAGEHTPGDHTWMSGENVNNVMVQFKVQVVGSEVIEIKQIGMKYAGASTATGVQSVIVALDEDENGLFNAFVDTVVGERAWPAGSNEMFVSVQPAVEMDSSVDAIKYFLVIYKMSPSAPDGSYTLIVNQVISSVGDESLSKSIVFQAVKTISSYVPPSCNRNGVRDYDESGVDCGGAYCPMCSTGSCSDSVRNGDESGVDCGGRCQTCPISTVATCVNGVQDLGEQGIDCGGACPTCQYIPSPCYNYVQDGDEAGIDCGGICEPCDPCASAIPSCDENSPALCNYELSTVSMCFGGQYVQIPQLFASQCAGQTPGDQDAASSGRAVEVSDVERCTPGTSVCFEGGVTMCAPDGTWMPEVRDEMLWNQYCENAGCLEGESFCEPTGMEYACRNGQFRYSGPCAEATECNAGELSCEYTSQEYLRCGENGRWLPSGGPQRDFDEYCPSDTPECNEGETHCAVAGEFEGVSYPDSFSYCSDNVWVTTEDPISFRTNCAMQDCEPGLATCDAESRTYRACGEDGRWMTFPDADAAYVAWCEQPVVPECADWMTVCLPGRIENDAFVAGGVQQCVNGAWVVNEDPGVYALNCAPHECEFGQSECDHVNRQYRVCSGTGNWMINPVFANQAADESNGNGDANAGGNALVVAQLPTLNRNPYLGAVAGITGKIYAQDAAVYEANCLDDAPPVQPQECVPGEQACSVEFDVEYTHTCNERGFWDLTGAEIGGDCGVPADVGEDAGVDVAVDDVPIGIPCEVEDEAVCLVDERRFVVCENGQFVEQQGDFDVQCPAGLPQDDVDVPPVVCNADERQCNPDLNREEQCVENQWLPIEQSAAAYQAACGSVECNDGWFACNPVDSAVSFCVNERWGPQQAEDYARLCEPETVVVRNGGNGRHQVILVATLGGQAEEGPQFSGSGNRVSVGDVVNNTVVVVRSIPAFPVEQPAPALAENQVIKTLKSLPWWIVALLVFFMASTLFSLVKYHNHLRMDKKGKGKK